MFKEKMDYLKTTRIGKYFRRSFLKRKAKAFFSKFKKKKAKKPPLKVMFVILHQSIWKMDAVFLKMRDDPLFEPIILIAPYILYGEEHMIENMEETFNYFKIKDYPVVKSYDAESKTYLDIEKWIKPDLIFMSNPHQLTKSEYYENLYDNYVCYYIPYSHQISQADDNYHSQYNQPFHNAMHRIFSPHATAKKIHEDYSDKKGLNVNVVGYPIMEAFLDKSYQPKEVWKASEHKKIRIIWAPHHTIDTPYLPYANFLNCHAFFQELVSLFKDKVQWAFKPHPILKVKLMEHADWGEEKTKKYWEFWEKHENCQLEEGEYLDLFLSSDAMIHDSGSFLAEYLYVNKPVLYLASNENIRKYFNPFGVEAFEACAHAANEEEILSFIHSLLNKIDDMKEQRLHFLEKNIFPYFSGDQPSDRILRFIKQDLGFK
jgi:hypothetical protein